MSDSQFLAYSYALNVVVWKSILAITVPFILFVIWITPGGLRMYMWKPFIGFVFSYLLAVWMVFFYSELFSFSGMKRIFGPNVWTMPIVSIVVPTGLIAIAGNYLNFRDRIKSKS